MKQNKLDKLLEFHKVQPVGTGYIDLIVKRENQEIFILELIEDGFEVNSISWWEWCKGESKSRYGLGGPKSKFYNGWFSELPIEIDSINKKSSSLPKFIFELINSKCIQFQNERITFENSKWLTPALWLNVPENWKNKTHP